MDKEFVRTEVKTKRIEWVDIYKAIGIVLMVIGHTTGKFNVFIYQFHMAAFFWISGYTTSLDNDSLSHYIYKKLYSLYLPLFTVTVVGAFIMSVLNKAHIYNIFYDNRIYPYTNFLDTIQCFLKNGDNYVWWLGAGWFVIVLFLVEIFQKIMYKLCTIEDKHFEYLHSILCAVVYILGYFCVKTGFFRIKMFDLVFISQIFFLTGYEMKHLNLYEKYIKKNYIYLIITGICFMYFYLTHRFLGDLTVDYPSRKFGNILFNYLSGVIGSVMLCMVSSMIAKLKYIKRLFIVLGNNTFGILLFHFLAFKIIFILMHFSGLVPLKYIQLIKPNEMSSYWWIVFCILTIAISYYIWHLLNQLSYIRIFLGDKAYWERKWTFFVNRFSYEILKIKELSSKLVVYYRKKHIKKKYLFGSIIVIIMFFMLNIGIGYLKPLTITFPVKKSIQMTFDDGWLPQGDEPYRWINKSGMLVLKKGMWDNISISGYVPKEFTNVTEVKVYINDEEASAFDLSMGRDWNLNSNLIQKYDFGTEIKINIVYNGVHVPNKDEEDIREISGLVSKIEFM